MLKIDEPYQTDLLTILPASPQAMSSPTDNIQLTAMTKQLAEAPMASPGVTSSAEEPRPPPTRVTAEAVASSLEKEPEPKRKAAGVPSDVFSILVTPTLSTKRRRLDTSASLVTDAIITPSPRPSSTSTGTPSFKDLYGEEALEVISIPLLQDLVPRLRHLAVYQRRNSVTKYQLQASAARHLSVLEAAKMTLEKLRRQELGSRKQNKQEHEDR